MVQHPLRLGRVYLTCSKLGEIRQELVKRTQQSKQFSSVIKTCCLTSVHEELFNLNILCLTTVNDEMSKFTIAKLSGF